MSTQDKGWPPHAKAGAITAVFMPTRRPTVRINSTLFSNLK